MIGVLVTLAGFAVLVAWAVNIVLAFIRGVLRGCRSRNPKILRHALDDENSIVVVENFDRTNMFVGLLSKPRRKPDDDDDQEPPVPKAAPSQTPRHQPPPRPAPTPAPDWYRTLARRN